MNLQAYGPSNNKWFAKELGAKYRRNRIRKMRWLLNNRGTGASYEKALESFDFWVSPVGNWTWI